MKPHWITATISGLVLLAAVAIGLLNLQTLSDLQVQTGALRAVHAGHLEAAGPLPANPPEEEPAVEDLTPTEQAELLRLRREQTELNRRVRDLAALEHQHAQLEAQLAQARANPGSVTAALPPGYILRGQARNAGHATPEAALETLLWAIEHRDRNALLLTLGPETTGALGPQLSAATEGEFWQEMQMLPGFQILGTQPQPDGTLRLDLAVVPGETTGDGPSMTARPVNGSWRIELR